MKPSTQIVKFMIPGTGVQALELDLYGYIVKYINSLKVFFSTFIFIKEKLNA